MVIKSPNDCNVLQSAIDSLNNWAEDNKMQLNIAKCKIMSFHRKRNPILTNYTINNEVLERVLFMRDLGVTFQPDLTFNLHINNVRSKAVKILGFINRNSKQFRNHKTFIILFFSLVRPILEYATVIWAPYYNNQISKLESVQHRFLRYLAYKQGTRIENHDYTEILSTNNMCTLQQRRIMLDVIFLYKILNFLVDCPDLLHQVELRVNVSNTRNKDIFHLKNAPSNISKNSPMNRMLSLGNRVTSDLDVDFFNDTIGIIKTRLSNHYSVIRH
ncbi:hypothetical protein WDU94_015562 [Cyamophila willieti]